MLGHTLGHYEILEPLGAGGMGEVYRARDQRLDRDVAIKVLPEAVAGDPRRLARFEREAKAVARLSHPNILEIHELGEHEGRPFMVTEVLEGETLAERLEAGPLGWRRATEIAAAIADGLGAAHQAGIVHRDLKPSNVFLTTDGRVKVLDFGLARALEVGGTGGADERREDESHTPTVAPFTEPGTTLGTVGYMSPEQVRGEPADHRSDIFSLGCVLYEMVAGRQAFARDTAPETMTAILREEPVDLLSLLDDLPMSLAIILRRCLEKRREARFQTGQDLAFAILTALQDDSRTSTRAASGEMSIVVLPFDNLSPDPDQEYFADGLTEEIIADLSKIRSLRVISRTSAMQLKGTGKSIAAIGRELDVQYALEGSVRKADNNLRITAQLIEAPSDRHLWAEKYSGTLDDVFEIQEQVSRSIVDALEVELSPDESKRIAERPIEDVRAYECYLNANRELAKFTEQGWNRAVRDLENGLEALGEDVFLLRGLGEAYLSRLEIGLEVDDNILKTAEYYANRIIELAPGSSHGHYLLARIEKFRGSSLMGIRYFERAFNIDPDSPDTLFGLALGYALHAGRPAPALQMARRLAEIDPLNSLSPLALGIVHSMAGHNDRAIRSLERHAVMEPEAAYFSRTMIVFILLEQGRLQEACELVDETTRQQPPDASYRMWSEIQVFARYAYQRENRRALDALSEGTKAYMWADPEMPGIIAGVFAVMGEKEEAFRWLEHAIDRGWINYPFFAKQDPSLDNIRGEDRFKRLMDRIRPEWERFEIKADLSGLPSTSALHSPAP